MASAALALALLSLVAGAACTRDALNALAPGPADAPVADAPVAPEPPVTPPVFEIKDDQFWRNGEAVQIVSGSLHYFRIHPDHWEDRLLRAKSLGLNAVSTYVPWNLHEPKQGVFSFTGGADLEAFLRLAHSHDLMVLLRLGPYICAEWDFGGLPAWLLNLDPKVQIRSEDPFFLAQVDAWWDVLLPRVQPFLWENGGPVVMVQVENEYGFYAIEMGKKVNTTAYLTHLVNKTQSILGLNTIIYTTDQANAAVLGNGTLNGTAVYTVIDASVGADYDAAFALQKTFNAPGMSPNFTAEFYLGWFTNWGEALPAADVSLAAAQLETILALNGSVNFYMAVGGTSFGFFSGANTGADKSAYQPQITSYDYTAPIGEGGDVTSPFYAAVRDVIADHFNASLPDAPELPRRKALKTLNLTHAARLFDVVDLLSAPVPAVWPSNMEYFNQSSGFILYSAPLPPATGTPVEAISIFGVKDRAHVYITTPAVPATPFAPGGGPGLGPVRRLLGVLERWLPKLKLPLAPAAPKAGDLVQILVEDMGRVNFGQFMEKETKGVGAVMMGFVPIFHWNVNSLPLDDLSAVPFKPSSSLPADAFEPTFFKGTFNISKPADTFLSLTGWTKGVAWVNGVNLGRFWPAKGPQCHLYVPGPILKKGANELVLLELDAPAPSLTISFTNTTDFTCGPVPLTPPALKETVATASLAQQ